jgi:hypothetical protein
MTLPNILPVVVGGLSVSSFEEILGPYLVFVMLSLLLPSKTMKNAKAVSSGKIGALYEREAFLEGA